VAALAAIGFGAVRLYQVATSPAPMVSSVSSEAANSAPLPPEEPPAPPPEEPPPPAPPPAEPTAEERFASSLRFGRPSPGIEGAPEAADPEEGLLRIEGDVPLLRVGDREITALPASLLLPEGRHALTFGSEARRSHRLIFVRAGETLSVQLP